MCKLNFFLQLIEKHPWQGSGGEGSSGFSSFPWCLDAKAEMEQDTGDALLDPFCRCACHLQCGMVAFPHPVPPTPITPWRVGSWREGEVLLLPGFIGEWRGAELCKSHMHSVPVMGVSRAAAACLEGYTSDFWGSNSWPLTVPREDKNYLGSSLCQ